MKKNILNKIVISLFIIFIVIPIIYTFGISLSLQNFKELNSDTFSLLGKSILVAFLIALFSTIFGLIISFFINKTQVVLKSFFKIALLIPLFISPYISAVAWKDFFYFFFGNTSLISSYFGVIFILTIIFTPLSMLIIGSALSNINSQIEESGLLISNLPKVILKIILPLIKPALITSFVLVFIFAISEFSVPAFLGVKVFTTEIFTQFSAFYNHSLAILQSLFLVLICILLLLAEKKHLADAPFFSVGTKGTSNKVYDIKNLNVFAFIFLLFWFFISVILPFLILFIQSFKSGTEDFLKAFELLKPTFFNSFSLAFIGAIIIIAVGFVSAYHSVNRKNKNTFDWLLLFVFAIPSIVLGISFIKFYNQSFLNFIYSSSVLIVIAYVGKFAFISSKIIGNSLKQIPKSTQETAMVMGVNPVSRVYKILLPQISTALFAAFIIGFILSLGELGTSIMLYPPGTEIMPIKVFTISANATQALTSSMTLIVFSVTMILISAFYFLFLKSGSRKARKDFSQRNL